MLLITTNLIAFCGAQIKSAIALYSVCEFVGLFIGADYMESFQPWLSFTPVSRAEISAWPAKDKILLR